MLKVQVTKTIIFNEYRPGSISRQSPKFIDREREREILKTFETTLIEILKNCQDYPVERAGLKDLSNRSEIDLKNLWSSWRNKPEKVVGAPRNTCKRITAIVSR